MKTTDWNEMHSYVAQQLNKRGDIYQVDSFFVQASIHESISTSQKLMPVSVVFW